MKLTSPNDLNVQEELVFFFKNKTIVGAGVEIILFVARPYQQRERDDSDSGLPS